MSGRVFSDQDPTSPRGHVCVTLCMIQTEDELHDLLADLHREKNTLSFYVLLSSSSSSSSSVQSENPFTIESCYTNVSRHAVRVSPSKAFVKCC